MIQVNTSSTSTQMTEEVQNKQRKKAVKPETLKEKTYQIALLVVDMVDTDLKRETRHYRTKSGQLLTSLDQIIQAVRDNNLLITVPGDTIFQVPPSFARCPYCGGRLYAGFRAWVLEEDGTWAGEEVELDCENEPDLSETEQSGRAYNQWLEQHSYMPYVYWLPIQEKVKAWINNQYRFKV